MFKLEKDKMMYLVIGFLVLVIIILVVSCIMKNKEGFTDLGSNKKVLVSDENGNIELYDVGNFLNGLTTKYASYDSKIKALEDKVSANTNRLNYHFPAGNNELVLNGKIIGRDELEMLRGEKDILIYNEKSRDNRTRYLTDIKNRAGSDGSVRLEFENVAAGNNDPTFRMKKFA